MFGIILHQLLHIEREVEADVQMESPGGRVLYKLSVPRNHANRYRIELEFCAITFADEFNSRHGAERERTLTQVGPCVPVLSQFSH